ncbi:MAG: VWA domain-containing protein [Bryobacterales bacterium]|nr:VWA domain-containing protein [Bryobacterales bacterium]MBV9398828.1 VWA domain-containing protein [Bryobacterales bacterium]
MCSALLGFQAPGENGIDVKPRARQASFTRPDAPPAEIRIDSSLVEIPVHVTRHDGSTVTNLPKEQFRVTEDGVEQKITSFNQDDAPLSIGILFDSSGSMHNKISKSSEAAATFFKTANLQDEFFLVEFNERPKLTVPFTPDSSAIFQRISHIKPFGRTSLFDAIHLALVHMKQAKNLRKAIVIVSDGGDNRSRFTATQVKNAMAESDVQLYAMGIFEHDTRKLPQEEQNGPRLLDELADQTGGHLYSVEALDELDAISERISRELRNEYVIGYSPANPIRDGKYRHVRVQVTPPPELHDLRTYYRHGYYAPTQ